MSAAFEQLVVRGGGIDPLAGKLLRSLFRQRQEADYGSADASEADAATAVADAERFVDAVERWLAAARGENVAREWLAIRVELSMPPSPVGIARTFTSSAFGMAGGSGTSTTRTRT